MADGAGAMADALRFNESIETLDLRGNTLGDAGASALGHALKVVGLETLSQLDLGYNEIKDDGAFALAQAMKANPDGAAASINMSSNYITKFGKTALEEAASLVAEVTGKEIQITY